MSREDLIINQEKIKENLIKYLTEYNKDAKPPIDISALNLDQGHCQGFTSMRLDEIRQKKMGAADWFYPTIKKIINWKEGDELSASEKLNFDTFISSLKFFQSPQNIIVAAQSDLSAVHQAMDKPKSELVIRKIGSSVLITEDVKQIYSELSKLLVKGPLITISAYANVIDDDLTDKLESHSMGIIANEDGSYTLYDSDYDHGDMIFETGEKGLMQLSTYLSDWKNTKRKDLRLGFSSFDIVPASVMQEDHKSSSQETSRIVDEKTQDINKALGVAAAMGDVILMKQFIELGADCNYQIDEEATPLACAANIGSVDGVKLLIEKANTDNLKFSLAASVTNGHLEITQLLLLKLEKSLSETEFKLVLKEIVVLAAKNNQIDTIKEILKYPLSETNLQLALIVANNNQAHSVKYFLKNCQPMAVVLVKAIQSGNVAKVTTLLEMGVNPNTLTEFGTPFECASKLANQQKSSEIKNLLILSEASVPAAEQPAALQTALLSGKHEVLKCLLKGKPAPDPNVASVKTMTPLMIAIGKLDTIAVDLLLEAGADPKAIPSGGSKNALIVVGQMLEAAQSAGDTEKFKKLSAIQVKLNTNLVWEYRIKNQNLR